MRLELKDYQKTAAQAVLLNLRKGSQEFVGDSEYTAVSLTAPTASGKTVIAASVIEQMLFGGHDGDFDPDPEAVFLWLTDNPALNRQTRRNILRASDKLQPGHLVEIDEDFDQATFDPGRVYFLNIQKLSTSSSFVRPSERRRITARSGGSKFVKRDHPIWETVKNTIQAEPGRYYLVIDEAHRGTGKGTPNRKSIAQRLISGQGDINPPSPVVLGITATSKRFDEAMAGADPARILRKVDVPVDKVRNSGLLKDVLSIHYQGGKSGTPTTLVREAVRTLKSADESWNKYTKAEDEAPVLPAMVLQVGPKQDPAEIGELIDVCIDEWDALTPDSFSHALESHSNEQFGDHEVPYVEPQNIQDHPKVRVVIFKEALTTGWDCPRAEVMVSLKNAQDEDYIAQLIGRMLRTPLARKIESDETLNRVFLYLPGFNLAAVMKVKQYLEEDPEAPPTAILINSVDAPRNTAVPKAVFAAFEGLPSYVVPSESNRSQVARLHRLAALLAGDRLLKAALAEADKFLHSVMEAERSRLDADGSFKELTDDAENAAVDVVDLVINSAEDPSVSKVMLETDIDDVDRIFNVARRKFRDGLADSYWEYRVKNCSDDPYEAKIVTIGLSRDVQAPVKTEAEAALRVKQWLKTYGDKISNLSADRKAKYSEIRAQTKEPEVVFPSLPEIITMPSAEDCSVVKRHLFSNASGDFNVKLTDWEQHVMSVETSRTGFATWYRNPAGGQRSLRVPFDTGGAEFGKMYPDFVFFHRAAKSSGELLASIVDPHGQHFSDAAPKLRGLGEYASRHGSSYARIIAVVKVGDEFLFIDLNDEAVTEALAGVSTQVEIEAVFAELGATYGS